MINPLWTDRDKQTFTEENSGKGIDPAASVWDSFSSSVQESFQAGPTMSIYNMAQAGAGAKYMTADEANEKYGLAGTQAAFSGEDKISDLHAERVRERHLSRQRNEAIQQEIENDYGAVGSIWNFAGALTGGMLDPINMAIGVGTGMAMSRLGTFSAQAVMSEIASQTAAKAMTKQAANEALKKIGATNVLGQQLLENFVASAIVDGAIVPESDKVMNQNVGLENRVFQVIGGTIMGGAIGTAIELPAVRQSRKVAHKMIAAMGSASEEVVEKSNKHAMMNVANGKKPNYDFEYNKMEYVQYTTRPGQKAYAFTEINNSEQALAKSYFIGRRRGQKGVDVITGQGDNAIVFVDNYNLAHNRVSSLDGKTHGQVIEIQLSEKLNILTEVEYLNKIGTNETWRKQFIQGIVEEFPSIKAYSPKNLDKIVMESRSLIELKQRLIDEVQDFKGVGSPNELINKILRDRMGYDGFQGVNAAAQMDQQYNYLALFKKETVERDVFGGVTMDRGLAKWGRSTETLDFDATHPDAADYMRPLQDMEKAEVARMEDPKQDIDYDPKAEEIAAKIPGAPEVAETDIKQELLEKQGIDLDQIKAQEDLSDEMKEHIDIVENEQGILEEANRLNAYCATRG
jgi:hypothetical protein